MKKKTFFVLMSSLLLMLLATVTGGAVMAVTIGENGSDTDPNNGLPLDNATPDSPHMGIDQQGHAATGSTVEQAELDDSKIDEYVMKYQAYKYPLDTDFRKLAKRQGVKTKKPKHPVIGEAILEANLKTALTNTNHDHEVTLVFYANDAKLFQESSTVRVFGVTGYDEQGNSNGKPLMLYITSNVSGTVKAIAVNGPIDSTSHETYVPNIGTDKKMRVMASALSESEVEVAPDNFLPQWRQAFLQKKVCAITKTQFYDKMKKDVAFGGQMLKDAVLDTFRRKCTSTLLIGQPGVIVKNSAKYGEEYCYFQEGIVTQLQNTYQFTGKLTIEDLIAITRIAFTKYSKSNQAEVYCGSMLLENLECIDFSSHPEMKMDTKRDELNVVVKSITTNFGTLNFKLEFAMDENGMSNNAILLPMREAIHYEYENTSITVDHAKGEGGEVRQASTDYYINDDCLMLTGLNSIFIGEDVNAAGSKTGDNQKEIISVSELPASGTAGKIYYLTEDDGTHSRGTYKYVSGAWVSYQF